MDSRLKTKTPEQLARARAWQKRYRELHPELIRARKAAYHTAHRDEIAARYRAYYEAHFNEIRQRNATWKQEHREQRLAYQRVYNREHAPEIREFQREWFQRNRERLNSYLRERYLHKGEQILARLVARARSYVVGHTHAEWEAKKAEYDHRCAYCGTQPQRLEKDHVVPVSKGDPLTVDRIDNIVPACRSCNARKGARAEWISG